MGIDSLIRSKLSEAIRQEALNLGFYTCGLSKAGHLEKDEQHVENWLLDEMHGEMAWMTKNREKRYDPTKLVPGAKSVISVLHNYKPDERLAADDNYKISSYAYGKDYHVVIKDKLYLLLKFIEEKSGERKARVFVDSAPMLDRAWAHKAGLGFIGKNTMLINRKGGSYFFIGHIVLDLELEYEDKEAEKSFCGSCTLCLKACPTSALVPFKLDSRKCISYLTIEHKSEIPGNFKNEFNDWIFGCDICQDVCPWNRDVVAHNEPAYTASPELRNMRKIDWQKLDKEKFNSLFETSPLQRAGFKGLTRNIKYLSE